MFDLENHILIGVDGGGTGCRAAVGTRVDGVLATAEGRSANATTDPDFAIKNIISTVNEAAQNAGISEDQLSRASAHLGLAGAITDADITRISQSLPYGESTVTDDRATAVAGALKERDGYLLSLGTGTIIAASHDGAVNYVGGWGFQVSDQASGAWLGRAALERVILCHDGLAEHSTCSKTIFANFHDDPNMIVAFSTTAMPSDFGTLAPTVVDAARDGDPWARSLLQDGATYLTQGLARLGFTAGDLLCLTGGLGPHYKDYLPDDVLIGLVPPNGSALDGAFALAVAKDLQREGSTL